MRVRYFVRASGPKGGSFRWECRSLNAARRFARRYHRKWGRFPTVWASVTIGIWSTRGEVRPRECATAIRQRALDARRTELERELSHARGDLKYHQQQIAKRRSWRTPPENEIRYHEERIPLAEERIGRIERWLAELPA